MNLSDETQNFLISIVLLIAGDEGWLNDETLIVPTTLISGDEDGQWILWPRWEPSLEKIKEVEVERDRSSHRRCFLLKSFSYKFRIIHGKTPVLEFYLIKLQAFRPSRLQLY